LVRVRYVISTLVGFFSVITLPKLLVRAEKLRELGVKEVLKWRLTEVES
jgi:hypothetical protein